MESPHHIGHPIYVPQSRRELSRLVEAVVDAFRDEVVAAIETFLEDPGPAPFLAVEEAVLGTFRHMAAHVLGGIDAFLHKGRTWVDTVVDRAREHRRPHPPPGLATYAGGLPRRRAHGPADPLPQPGPSGSAGSAPGRT